MIVGYISLAKIPHKRTDIPRGGTVSGYGRRIPTSWMVQMPGSRRWRRVYCAIWSNAGTCYVEAQAKSAGADGRTRPDWIVVTD